MAEPKQKFERIHCNECGQRTKHLRIFYHTRSGSEPHDSEYDISWTNHYDLFECCGCESVTLRRKSYFSEWNSGDVDINYYPPRIARKLPVWKNKLKKEIRELLSEVYKALQSDSPALSMMGARALIDLVILQEVGDVGTFKQKLEELESKGFLSKNSREILDAALDVGNAASHRGFRPDEEQIDTVMDIVEHLLQSTVLKKGAEELKKVTSQRTEKKKS